MSKSSKYADFADGILFDVINEESISESEDTAQWTKPFFNIISQRGDIWLLDKHRLMCGDSTNADDVCRLMNGKKAALFATDPPYLVDYNCDNSPVTDTDYSKRYRSIRNREKSVESANVTWDKEENDKLYSKFIDTSISHAIMPNAAWYCWHAGKKQGMLEDEWSRVNVIVHQQIIWVKTRAALTYSHYMWQHEPCLFGWIKNNKPPRVSKKYLSTVWHCESVGKDIARLYPTSKPIKLFATPMEQHLSPDDICYEPFSGSGSQIIAGETMNRAVYAMEIEPKYVDATIRRWQLKSNKQAILEETGHTLVETIVARYGDEDE